MRKISFVIPAFNEENYIGLCIESIINACIHAQYSNDDYEILLIDGCSTDQTINIAAKYQGASPVRLLMNERKILAAGWNKGIANARYEYICAMNAHATLSLNFVVEINKKYTEYSTIQMGAVGPVLNTSYLFDDDNGRAIAFILGSSFGVGNSKFRTGTSDDVFVDTLHCCVYKSEAINSIGVFNERLIRSQDIDFNKRLIAKGYNLLLINSARANYFSKIHPEKFLKYVIGNGYWVTYPLKHGVLIGSLRHYIPLSFFCYVTLLPLMALLVSPYLIAPLIFYLILIVFYSIFNNKFNFLLRVRVLKYFFVQHYFYGLGSFLGLMQVIRGKSWM